VIEPVEERFAAIARSVNAASGSPVATVLALAVIAVWATAGPAFHFSDTWQLVMNTASSLVTFVMVFILNNAQARDTRAINLKLDELVRSVERADNAVIALEEKPVSEVAHVAETIKQAVEEAAGEQVTHGSQ
jgi:low affinity Fe/Cu permease